MCGIVGFIGKKDLQKLSSLLTIIEYRGHDGTALFYSSGVHLGMNRLAIIDLTPNLYPMKYKQHVMIFNGEIYNYQELKQQLLSKGVEFKTNCDGEVILPLFHQYGYRAFSMLEGQFAISIYDAAKKKIILVRDKSGEKPLYVANRYGSFMFASEIKVLLSFDKKKWKLRKASLSQYFRQGFIFSPDTLVEGIQKVPPSCCFIYDMVAKKSYTKQYWKPRTDVVSKKKANNENAYINRLEELLRRAVALRLVADVPVGSFLSGGVDSSLITLFASEKNPNIQTYSASFPGYETEDESKYSTYIANRLQTRHTSVSCTPDKVLSLIAHIGELIDEPILDPAILPSYLMAKEARKHVKVVLTGEGGDELFGGYSRYYKHLMVENFRRLFATIPMFLQFRSILFPHRLQRTTQPLAQRYSAQRVWEEDELSLLQAGYREPFPQHVYLKKFADTNPLLSMQLTDYRGYLAEQVFMQVDKSTMACNLEARSPFVDTQVTSFAFSLPTDNKIRLYNGKYLLKKVAEKYFPKSFVWRPKHGFDVPLNDWFRKELKPFVYHSLDSLAMYKGLFNIDYCRDIIADHMDEKSNHADKIWSLLVLGSWLTYHKISL